MATGWIVTTRQEALDEAPPSGLRLCQVPGCEATIPGGNPRARRCPSCIERKLMVAPCKGCGGQIRRCDQSGVAPSRRGYCATCRGSMPIVLSPGCWAKGQSGNPRGTRTYEPFRRARSA
jgi:hypothetical protein